MILDNLVTIFTTTIKIILTIAPILVAEKLTSTTKEKLVMASTQSLITTPI